MKIAVFGDIHGNIEALKTACDAATALRPEKFYHLGDLGGYAPFVNEVVDFLVKHNIEGVQGNYDEAVANDREHCGCKAEEPLQEEMAHRSFSWTKEHVSPQTKAYMKKLPTEIKFMPRAKRSCFSMPRRKRTISTGTKTGRKSSFMRWPKRATPTS